MHGTIQNAGRVLAILDTTQVDMGVTELAQQLDEPTSTVHDLLQSLVAIGLLTAMPNGRYCLGWETVRLGYVRHWYIQGRVEIQRALHELVNKYPLFVGFSILDEDKWILVDHAISPDSNSSQGSCRLPPLYSFWPASAKVIWAARPWPEVEAAIAKHGLIPGKDNSVGVINAYRQELDRVRHQGFGYNEAETTQCIAAPVLHPDLGTVGALLLFSRQGLFVGRIEEYGQILAQAAQKLSKALSHMDDPLKSVFPPRYSR